MNARRVYFRALLGAVCISWSAARVHADVAGTAFVRHAPTLNSGTVDGSLQQMLGENLTLNGGVVITRDVLVPGLPNVRLNGRPTYAGTLDGAGTNSPANYQVTLNGNVALRNVVRRTDPVALPVVAAPPAPAGTRTVVISSVSDSAGNFATLRNLTLNGNTGQVAVPSGTYGDFTANGGSGFTLGIAGATRASVYNFQRLTLNGQAEIRVLGPVVITVANGFTANGPLGAAENSSRLILNVYSGGLTLNGGSRFYGYVNAPNGLVIVNGNSQLVGGVACDQLTVNGGGLLRLQPFVPFNQPPVANPQSVSTNEDTAKPITLTASDPDGNALTYTYTPPAHGTLGGTAPNLTYTPALNYNGPDSFSFLVNDGTTDSAPAAVSITVVPVNDPPVADSKAIPEFDEDTSATVILTGSDPEGGALTFVVTVEPQHGTYTLSGATVTYTPNPNYYGADQFSYVARDDAGAFSAPAVVSLSIRPVNDAPIATAITRSGTENTNIAVTLLGTDIENDPLTYTYTQPAHGTLTGTAPNLVYRSAANFSGIDSFTYYVNDGKLNSAPAAVTLAINNPNDPPVANPQNVETPEDTPLAITLTGSDPDGDTLTFEIVSNPQNGTLSGSGANRTYTPAANFNGSDSFKFLVRDGQFASNPATITITVKPVNDAPVADAQSLRTAEDAPLAITLTGSDVENSPLTFTYTQPAHGTITGTAPNITYTPALNYNGSDAFKFRTNDGALDSAEATITLDVTPVNDAPTALAQSAITPEDTALTLTLTGSDVENSPLIFEIVTPPQHGTYTLVGATFTFTPEANYNGADTFSFKVNDGQLDSATPAAVTLTITPQPDRPLAADQSITVPETAGGTLTLGATDADGDALTFNYTQPSHGTVTGTAPNLTYTPVANYVGSDSFTFTATDPSGLVSNTATVSITVYDVNTPPVARNQAFELDEDTSRTFTPDVSDADNDALTYTLTNPPANGALLGFPSVPTATPPSITYTPAANFAGTDSFTYEVRDGSQTPATATVTFTVKSVNDRPVANAQALTTSEDTPRPITLTGSDVENSALIFAFTQPSHGTLSGTAPNLTYTPSANYFGNDAFTFTVTDDGGLVSTAATVAITVTPVNDAPVAGIPPVTTPEDTPVTITLSATDVENDPLTYSYTQPAHGFLSGTAPRLTYTPHANYNGPDSFTFKARDTGPLDSNTATVSITVTPVNDAPVANAQTVFTQTGTPTAITLTGSDIENSPLTFAIVTAPAHGTITGTPPNITYTSAADFGGFDSFTFTVNDGQLTSTPATVQITSGLPPRSKTYTTTTDFAAGSLTGIKTDIADQISNKIILASFDNVWIANSSKGTVIKIDSETGRVLGEFLSAPPALTTSPYPSRIAVDSKGNVWVANLSHDSIVKIGNPDQGFWVDRNHNGQIDSSAEFGDARAWTGTDISGAADEAILLYVRTEVSGVKQISIDADDNVWVGGASGAWQKFDGKTGALLRTEPSIGQGGNGGYIAPDGKMYSASRSFLIWNTANPISSLPQDDSVRAETWASAVDSKGNLWTTRDWTSTVMKYSPTGELIGEYYHGEPWAMGIAIDANDHVWVAHSHCGHSVGHLLSNGQLVGNVEVANHGPVEVSIDRHGRIWVASSTGVVDRINPLAGPLGSDGVTPVGEVDVKSGNLGGALWTYGRFTGSSFGLASPDGLWTNIYDGQLAGTTWGPVVWNGLICNDGKIQVEAALSADGAAFGPFQTLTLASPTPSGSGRYLKTRVRLSSSTTGDTPALYDLTVGTAGYTPPSTSPSWTVSAGDDIKGNWPDVIQLKGAFCHSVHAFPTEPTYAWSVVSAPSGAAVTFNNPAVKRPTAQFSAQGTYVLRLTATLGTQVSTDDVQVALTPYNRAPYPNAGYTIFRADFPSQLWLWGSVRDDGLPAGNTVTTTWEKLFGPGTVTFANPNSPTTTASFSAPGVYVLKLKASDGELVGEDVTTVWLGFSCIPTAPDGLVSWWQAAGNGDDHIGGNQAFTEKGADYTEGKIGGAFRFDGVNDRVRVFSAPTLDTGAGQGITLELWLNPSSDRVATIFEYGQNATHGFSVRQLGRAIEANFREANGTSHTLTTGTVLTVGTWTHVTTSYDKATGEGRIYINGVPQVMQTVGSFTLSTALDIFMGGAANQTEYYAGLLDEVSVYKRALYADEVNAIVSHPAGKRPPVSNVPPVVNAGPDLAGKTANTPVALAGSVVDDGQPTNGSLFIKWSKVSGPGTVSFANEAAASTTATFSEGGVYVLKLFADDGGFCTEDLVEVRVGALYRFDTDASVSAWWMANDSDLDAVQKLKLERFNGLGFGPGQAGEGFVFDGSNDYGRVTAHSATNLGAFTAGFTIEFWAKPAQIGSDKVLLWWGNSSTTGMTIEQYDNGGREITAFMRDTNGTSHNIGAGNFFSAGTWIHVAITYDRTTGIARIYKNGVLANEQNLGIFTPRTNLPLYVGATANAGAPFSGALDELTFFNRPLTLDEVQAIYQGGVLGKVPLDNNTPPVISAGGDVRIFSATGAATLAGSVVDDGRPVGNTTAMSWSLVQGPGTVTFGNPQAANTTATFSAPGTYILRLDANDGLNQPAGDVVVVRVAVTDSVEPDSALSVWWPGNGDVHEIVRGNHDIEFLPRGPSFADGEVAQGFAFNGVDHYGRLPAHPDFDIGASTTGFTIEFWAKPAQIGNDKVLLWWGSSSVTGMTIEQYDNGGREITAFIRDTNGTSHNIGVGNFFSANTWVHVAVTYDHATGIARIYKDGALANEQNLGIFTPRTNLPLQIGATATGGAPFSGVLDELGLYTRPLSLADVRAIYLAGAAGKASPDDNLPPVINAGPDVFAMSATATVSLSGSVVDDGRPLGGTLTIAWSKLEGPGTVTFADPAAASTTATFSAPGVYVLQLSANDGINAGTPDTMVVRVGVSATVEPDSALALWWPANGDVHEIVRGNHDIEFLPRGPSFTTGEIAQGFNFNGTDHYGRVAAHADLDIGASAAGFTVEFWAKPSQIGSDKVLLWWGSTSTTGMSIEQYDNGGRELTAFIRDTSGGTHNIVVGGYFSANAWHHIAVTYDRVTGIARIYRNGALLNEQNLGIFTPRTNLPLNIGANASGGAPFAGVLDEISLYTRPLSIVEINSIYQAGAAGKAPPDDNLPPVINAGPDVLALPPTSVAILNGTVTDDGRPVGGALTMAWSKLEGPGTVTFADAAAASTTATFSVPGTYVLQLSAHDGMHAGTPDTVVVRAGVGSTVEPDSALALWWPANGDVREVVHGNHDIEFLPRGPSFTMGEVGQGFNFNGTDYYGRVAAHADLDIGASAAGFTVEFWAKPSQIGSDKVLLWWGSTSTTGMSIEQYDNGGRELTAFIRDTNGTSHNIVVGGYFTSGAWHHIAVTYDRVTGIARIYRNGALLNEQNLGVFTPRTNLPLNIGANASGGAPFAGVMDEIALYTRPLSIVEINAIYVAGVAGKAPIDDNQPPSISGGPDLIVPSVGGSATLLGSVIDDGRPAGGALTIAWSKVEGPGTVTFANPAAAVTSATFSAPGTYMLRLDASDGFQSGVADIVVVRVALQASIEPDPALAVWWPGNGDVHEVARGNHDIEFIPRGPNFTSSQVAQGFSFSGAGEYGRVAAHNDLDIGASAAGFTVEFWAKPAQIGADKVLLWWGNSSATGLSIEQYDNGGRELTAFMRDTSGGTHNITVGGYFTANAWHHIAVTYDRVTGIARIYRNGSLLNEQNLGVFTVRTNLPLYFGANASGGAPFQGILDEIALYQRPLTPTEIIAIYQAGAVGKLPFDNNQPPAISAGPDLQIPAGGTANLAGIVLDDGRPATALNLAWSLVDGPGSVTFANPNVAATTATFSANGTYILRLAANDGINDGVSDLATVRVGLTGGVVADSALAAWWPANGDVHEVMHGNHDAEFLSRAAIFASGQVSQGFFFDGSADRARIAAHSDLDIGASAAGFTVELWAKPAQIGTDKVLLWWGNSSATGISIEQYDNGGRELTAFIRDTSGGTHNITVGGYFSANAWHHIAVTYDRVMGIARIYRNGALLNEQNLGIFTPRTNLPLNIGANANGGAPFAGVMDEIALYTRPLAASEVLAIYNAGAAGKLPLATTVAPVAVLADPASGSSVVVDTAFTLSALAADADGSVAKVEFFDGATKLGETTGAQPGQPQVFRFTASAGLSATGRHLLTAVATDNDGFTARSGMVYLDVHAVAAPRIDSTNVTPTVALVGPPSGAAFVVNTPVTFNALAADTDGVVARVEFYDGAAKLGETTTPRSGQPLAYDFTLAGGFGAIGRHVITARAIDDAGGVTVSIALLLDVVPVLPEIQIISPANHASLAAGAPVILQATATYSLGAIARVEFYDGPTKLGQSTTPTGSTYALTLPAGFNGGSHTLTAKAIAADGAAAISTAVAIKATTNAPSIVLTAPENNATLAANQPFTLTATTIDSDGTITKVEFFRGSVKLGEDLTAPYSFTVTAGLPNGTYSFTARATDNSALTTTSTAVNVTFATYSGPAVAEIVAPAEDARLTQPTTVTGVVAHSSLASWAIDYRLKAAEGATPEAWTTFGSGNALVGTAASGNTPAVPGTLGTFDPTGLINGIYELRLRVTDTSGTTTVDGPITVVVEGNMKIGAFSLAFEDLKVPVAGIPITITRTYDSRDTRVGDFGPGWRLALANIRVQKNRSLGKSWYQTPQSGNGIQFYNVDPVGDRIVTVVMPDGETHRFKIGAYVKNRAGDPDDASFAVVVTQGTIKFYPLGDTTSKLEPLDSNNQLFDHFYIGGTGDQDIAAEDVGSNPFAPPFNTTRFRLTTKDGTVFILDEALGLLEMRDLDGNTLVLNRDAANRVTGVTATQNAPGGPIARSVTIHRDATGRVDYIRDLAGKELDYLYDAQGRLASFTNRELNTTQFRYENTAFPYYLTKIIDPRGVTALRSEYDPTTGKLIKQIDADGKETVFNRGVDTTGRFEKVEDRLGNETTFYYDDRGNVTLKIDPLGAQTSYSYWPDSDRVKFEIDHYGNVKSFAYDAQGNITVQTIGANTTEDSANPTTGYTTRTTYNAQSAPTQITDPDGRVQTFSYDPTTNNLLTHTLGAGGTAPATTTYTYKSDGSLDTITDALGNTTSHVYNYTFSDPAYPGAVKQITVTVTDPAGAAGSDPSNAAATVLRTTRTLFDAQENQLAQIVTRTLPDGTSEDVVTRYLYDAENRLVATVMPDGRVTETRYTSFGKEDKVVLWKSLADYRAHDDANARVTSYDYDARGNQTSVTYADGTSEATGYDLENRKLWSQDRRGYRTFFSYDAVGRLRFTIHPDANDGVGANAPSSATDSRLGDNPRTETQYDLAGRVRFQMDERGATTEFTYEDGCGCAMRRKQMIQHRSVGNLVTHYDYDKAGNVRFVTDPRGNIVETRYDDQGRPQLVIYPATDEHPSTQTETKYDALGRRIELVDQEGKVTRYRYDALGRLTEVRQYVDASAAASDSSYQLSALDSRLAVTRYSYDELGNQQTQVDALGRVTTYWTDLLGRRTKRILPKDTTESAFLTETLQYDEWGNLSKRTDFAGKATTFTYDALNRLKSKSADPTHPSLAFSHAIARIEFDYDANGARIAARTFNAANTQLHTESTPRDERGRIDYKDTAGGRLDYSYYANNLLKDVVSSNSGGVNVGYRYDEVNRLESVDDTSTGLPTRTTAYTYNANGSLETLTQPNGVVHTYGYDALNRLRGVVVARGTTLLHSYEYKLNPSGHRRQVVENSARMTTYTYDDLYRLTGESIASDANGNNGAVDYTLDKVGNRQSRNSSVPSVASVLNQSYNARDWLSGDTYNANGSTQVGRTVRGEPPGTDTYDFEERLILRTKSDGSTINVSYDADGHRIAKNILSATAQPVSSTSWLVDTNNLTSYAQVLEERTSGGTTSVSSVKVYTYGTSLISQAVALNSQPSTLSYYTVDGHGNVRELTDASGTITDRYDYDAFGNLVFRSGTTSNAFLYCGELFDSDLGLYCLRARYLNTDTGRFWSMDIFEGDPEAPQSVHKYCYANCDPINGIDPSGFFTLAELMEAVGANEVIEASRIIIANRGRKKAIQVIGCVVGAEGIKRAIDYEMHHPIPLGMGGPDKNLMPLPSEAHRMFHFVLNILIKADPKFKGFTGYSSADKWAEKLVGTATKRAMLVLIEQAARYIDKQCKLPKPFRIIDFIEKNKNEWLKS